MTIPEPPAGRIIPLIPGVARGAGDRRVLLRDAVLQVVDHLVLESVPPSRRAELFDQAMDLLDEAGWGLDELYAAATEPQARKALLNALGLLPGGFMYPYQIRLPLAPYRFLWKDGPAVSASKRATELFTEEDYLHSDGTHTVIREYRADGSYHILSDRGEIELVDNATDPYAPDPVSVVMLP
jgi:hypothetical protein